mmetsp:Transcript_11212/g.17043  ORF Transcript_11212/g.17043 Transcript_11212/m.17043 type:complete len:99 (-) Transcript_11212:122-418(-)
MFQMIALLPTLLAVISHPSLHQYNTIAPPHTSLSSPSFAQVLSHTPLFTNETKQINHFFVPTSFSAPSSFIAAAAVAARTLSQQFCHSSINALHKCSL